MYQISYDLFYNARLKIDSVNVASIYPFQCIYIVGVTFFEITHLWCSKKSSNQEIVFRISVIEKLEDLLRGFCQ